MTRKLTKAEWKAHHRWSQHQHVADHPEECRFCERRFKTARGLGRHLSYCWNNPESRRFTTGGYDGRGGFAITHRNNGKVTGYRWRGESIEMERRIVADMRYITEMLTKKRR